jgi:hypothetical protein
VEEKQKLILYHGVLEFRVRISFVKLTALHLLMGR